MAMRARKVRRANQRLETPADLIDAARAMPGILDLVALYGGYEEMVRQVDVYLKLLQPEQAITTSNSSTPS